MWNTGNDLRSGNIKRQLVQLTIPLLIGNIFQQLYNMADVILIGRYVNEAAFASIGVAGTVMNLFLFMISGFCTGVTVFFARLYGRNDETAFRKGYEISVKAGGLLAVALSVVCIGVTGPLLGLLHTPAELTEYCLQYLWIIAGGLIFTYLYQLFAAILRSVGDTRSALYFLLISVGMNIVLDVLFISVFHMEVKGAACATVLSQAFSALLCRASLFRTLPQLKRAGRKVSGKEDLWLLKDFFSFGSTASLHQVCLYFGKMIEQSIVNQLGVNGIAAFTAAVRIEGFINSFGDSGAAAITLFLAQNVGERQRERRKKGFFTGTVMLVGLGIVSACIMNILAEQIMGIFIDAGSTQVMEAGISYLKTVSWFYVFCFIGSAMVGYFRGNGKMFMPVMGTTLQICIRVAMAFYIVPRMGLGGLGICTGCGWIGINVFMLWQYYRTGKDENYEKRNEKRNKIQQECH